MQHPPASGQSYVSRTIPYADVYWRFYSQTIAGVPAAPMPLDLAAAEQQLFAPGSKAIVAVDEPLAAVLDRTGWRRSAARPGDLRVVCSRRLSRWRPLPTSRHPGGPKN